MSKQIYTATCMSIITIALGAGGCTVGQKIETGTQTHFDMPNSNIRAMGTVTATYKSDSVFVSGEDKKQLFQAALDQYPGSNLVLDYTIQYVMKQFFMFDWTEMTLTGTAADMTVGDQELH